MEARGQEVDRPAAKVQSHSIAFEPLEESRSTKSETDDRIHTELSLGPLFQWCLSVYTQFLDRLVPSNSYNCMPVIRNSWASIYRSNDFHDYHIHPNAAFVGVYSVLQPQVPPPQGSLNLQDPRSCIGYYSPILPLFSDESRSITLQEGTLILFPGWLRHSVSPFSGPGQRVTISMNLGFDQGEFSKE